MPIYEYECAKCGGRIEVIQKMSDKPLKKHVDCGGVLTKLISASGFRLKGTGWYVTDYAKKGSTETAESSKGDAKESNSKDSKESKDSKDSKDSKETSSNGNKESSSTGKSTTEKAGKKDSTSKSGKKD